mmetsp:Transcript_64347/g.199246  ORF Transcript_64347/g.199246 Transcript_64347/m.199246 type:complete len:242 (-) Transcript_64347:234-959(-)
MVKAGLPISRHDFLLGLSRCSIYCGNVEDIALERHLHVRHGGEEVPVKMVHHHLLELVGPGDAEVVGARVPRDLLGDVRVEVDADTDEGYAETQSGLLRNHGLQLLRPRVLHVREEDRSPVPAPGMHVPGLRQLCRLHRSGHPSGERGAAHGQQRIHGGEQPLEVDAADHLQRLEHPAEVRERRHAQAVVLPQAPEHGADGLLRQVQPRALSTGIGSRRLWHANAGVPGELYGAVHGAGSV